MASNFYSHSTASDEWHRESERHGMERDRLERLLKHLPTESSPPPTPEPKVCESYEEFHRRVTEEDTWWDKWKAEHLGF